MRSPASAAALLVLVVAAGAVLRLAGLPDQSLWIDEVYTLADIDRPLGDIVPRLRAEESTPPVYFWMAWGWTHVFDGDLGLRSLSLLCGLAAIPVAFALGAGLAGPWSGLAAAALIAANPFMVWYSQEGRAYALLTLLGLLSVLLLIHAARRRSLGLTVAWGAICALALATHYFAAVLVWPEAVWMLLRRRSRVTTAVVAGLAAVQVALLSLAVDQRGNTDFIAEQGVVRRFIGVPKQFLLGQFADELDSPLLVGTAAALGLATVAYVLLQPVARREAAPLMALAAGVLVIPVLLAAVGADRVNGRNLILGLALALVAAGVGLASAHRRLGLGLLTLLLMLFTGVSIAVALTPRLQRDDWESVARTLRTQPRPIGVVVDPRSGAPALRHYASELRPMAQSTQLERVAYVRVERPVRPLTVRLFGFTPTERVTLPSAEIALLAANSAGRVPPESLAAPVGGGLAVSVFVLPR